MNKRKTIRLLRKIAKDWDRAELKDDGRYHVPGTWQGGLCISFAAAGYHKHPILRYLPPEKRSGYCWSFGKSGAKARARWCRKIADKLERGEINVE